MKDFKIRMDGLVEGTTGFQALRPKNVEPGANKSGIVLSR